MKNGGRAASVKGNGGSKTVNKVMMCFCPNEDVRAKSMAREVLELCPQIKKLSLKFARMLDLMTLLTNCLSALEELNVVRCTIKSNTRSSSRNRGTFPQLHSLTFEACQHVTDHLLLVLAEMSPRLSHLSVDCTTLLGPAVGDSVPSFRGLARLLEIRPTLTRLSMSDCFNDDSSLGAREDDSNDNRDLWAAGSAELSLQAVFLIQLHYCGFGFNSFH
jgi:hypothetical protein